MAAGPEMRYPRRRANDGGLALQPARVDRRGVPQQLLDSGRTFMLLAAAVLTWRRLALASCNPEHVLAAFVLWLLGAALAMLPLVAEKFPRLAAAGAALARALRSYLLGSF